MYSDMSMRVMASSSPNRNSASVRASSVLPTPDGPRKTNEPVGRFGSFKPARERRIALEMTSTAACCPMTRLWSSSSIRMSFWVSASVSLNTGMPVHIETMSAISSSPIAGRSLPVGLARLPLLLELALLVRQAPLLVAEVGRLLELLRLDRGLLLAPRRLDLLLELPVHGRGGHRLDAHPRRRLVDEVDRLVGKLPVGDVPVGELGRGDERLVCDLDLVVLLVAVAQALEDLHGLFRGRLVHADLLEAALQRAVALEVLAVLVERGGAHSLQLRHGPAPA